MNRLEWNTQYSVGIEKIDQQHARLFELANLVAKHTGGDGNADILEETIAELHRYAEEHFTYEESILAEAGYAELPEHHKMHAAMRARLDLLTAQLKRGQLTREELIEFMESWLTLHILREDMKYMSAVRGAQKN